MKKILIFLFSAVFLFSCSKDSKEAKKAKLESLKKDQSKLKEQILALEKELNTDTTDKSKLVAITEIQPSTFNHYIEIQGKIDGDQDLTLSAEAAGNVTSISVSAGDHVSKGQVLATIDDKIIRQGISELQTQLDLATQVFNRRKNLWDQKIGSEIDFLSAKTNKDALEHRMASLQEQLDLTRIKSPIDGIVDEVMIKTGQTLAPGIPAFHVVNLDNLKVKGEVAESFIGKVHRGDEAILYFPDQNKEVNVKLDYSGNRIDPVNRTFHVEVRLNQKQGDFRPNMITVIRIVDYKNTNAFSIPLAAVQKSGDGEFVFVVKDEKGKMIAHRKTVQTGLIYNGIVEIKSGLDAGDKVITTGYLNVVDGDEIKL
ncbi:MAG: efflux RND transporter periplasmic adaptor subunit [Bacteroidia bacterium]